LRILRGGMEMAILHLSAMLSATEKQAALERIGSHRYRGRTGEPTVDPWNVANWFVTLAKSRTPFADMAPVEVELRRQEYRALQEELTASTGKLNQDTVTVDALETFRSAVRHHLEQLADAGRTEFGPFVVTRSVFMPRRHESSARALEQQVVSGDFVKPHEGQGLLYHLSGLIGQIGLAILRCPYCKQVFLRPRADATYCSRPCQANAHARKQREAAKVETGARKGRRGKTKRQHAGPHAKRKPNPFHLVIKARAMVRRKPKPARKPK
jgi:hypothetical protein